MKSLVAIFVLLGSSGAFAQGKESRPCQQIKSACEAAGFIKGGHKEKKGLYKDCLEPIMAGQSVAGVMIGADLITACKDNRQAHNKVK
ncbi:MAG TPA: hypothetical protein VIG33_15320 [Pseudobdellovibrionaceae bacterium]|jgi:hypothetical protein